MVSKTAWNLNQQKKEDSSQKIISGTPQNKLSLGERSPTHSQPFNEDSSIKSSDYHYLSLHDFVIKSNNFSVDIIFD